MGVKLSKYQVERKCKEFAKKIWGVSFNVPISISGRMTRALGQYRYKRKSGKPVHIQFSKYLINYGYYSEEKIDQVIKHELCHWYLQQNNQPYHDHHPIFENEIKRIGAATTNEIEAAGDFHVGICDHCKEVVIRKRNKGKRLTKYFQKAYTTKCCGASIVYDGKVFYDENGLVKNTKQNKKKHKVVANKTKETKTNTISIEKLVQPGPRGVTNKQMIPSIRKIIEKQSIKEAKSLKNHYPDVFNSSFKYLRKSEKQIIKKWNLVS